MRSDLRIILRFFVLWPTALLIQCSRLSKALLPEDVDIFTRGCLYLQAGGGTCRGGLISHTAFAHCRPSTQVERKPCYSRQFAYMVVRTRLFAVDAIHFVHLFLI
ncbi:hypothetical protein CALVIDRAFT_427294 [Calocera viscosa TUFC12733]|uniref:Secreted protein n=1 Tax=Calocera viscosa (strain TUFC12733) TaxID=1330018 RepID=A0A167PKX5_CALVF|nr:hypothetical protein CALVIDRAFT_427294 [Calocera viscosa TUFC12733]